MTEDVPLPGDGPALIAGVPLPAGQRIYGMGMGRPSLYDEPVYAPDRSDAAVAWVTSAPMADAGDAWLALSDAHFATGLVPVLLSGGGADPVSGDAFGFYGPEDVGLIDTMDPRSVLAGGWDLEEEEDDLDPGLAEVRAPFGPKFPGLTPAQQARLPMAVLREAVIAQQPAFLGLVAASRPADVPAAVGWSVFGSDRPGGPEARSLEIAAVLRSWEARFGARPLRIGSDTILLVLVERPPGTQEAAIQVAAEHLAFASEYGTYSGPIREYAAELIGQPVWHFWWD